jgi:hypothetical protein
MRSTAATIELSNPRSIAFAGGRSIANRATPSELVSETCSTTSKPYISALMDAGELRAPPATVADDRRDYLL